MKGSSRLRYWELPPQNGILFSTDRTERERGGHWGADGEDGRRRRGSKGVDGYLVGGGRLAARAAVSLK